ncbi:MAG TPA: hypothetical protein VIO16_07380 [Dehalococcoidia bacterium]
MSVPPSGLLAFLPAAQIGQHIDIVAAAEDVVDREPEDAGGAVGGAELPRDAVQLQAGDERLQLGTNGAGGGI